METLDYFFFIYGVFRFKSYYVVWKQHKTEGNEYGKMSLNRTM